jgi:aminoglycoside phosphotransferase (APT) family kinase protein
VSEPVGVAEVMNQGLGSDERGAIVAPAVRDLDALAVSLAGWLSGKLARDLRIANLSYPRGSGQSAETLLFDAVWGDRRQGYAVRIRPTGFPLFVDDVFAEQVALMRLLGASGVPVAPVRWYEEDPAVLGSEFFVMDKLPGRVAVSIPSHLDAGWVAEATTAQRRTLWEGAVRALAAVQSVPPAEAPFLALPGGDTGFEQEWHRWERSFARIDRPDRPLPGYRALLEDLRASVPAHRPEGIVWGDARLGNMLVDEDFRIVALMDFEQPSLGGALHDLGWWLISQRGKVASRAGGLLSGMLDRADTIALWHETTGVSTEAIDWYEAYAAWKMAVNMVRMLDLRGQQVPGGPDALFHARAARELLG